MSVVHQETHKYTVLQKKDSRLWEPVISPLMENLVSSYLSALSSLSRKEAVRSHFVLLKLHRGWLADSAATPIANMKFSQDPNEAVHCWG